MNSQYNLGTSVVLNPADLNEGDYLEMDGKVLVVHAIDGEHVLLHPVVGIELLLYRILKHKVIYASTFIVVLAGLCFFYWR